MAKDTTYLTMVAFLEAIRVSTVQVNTSMPELLDIHTTHDTPNFYQVQITFINHNIIWPQKQ